MIKPPKQKYIYIIDSVDRLYRVVAGSDYAECYQSMLGPLGKWAPSTTDYHHHKRCIEMGWVVECTEEQANDYIRRSRLHTDRASSSLSV